MIIKQTRYSPENTGRLNEPFEQLLHDRIGGILRIELSETRLGFEGDHMEVLLCLKRKKPTRGGLDGLLLCLSGMGVNIQL